MELAFSMPLTIISGARDELRTGLNDWIASEFYKQFRSKGAAIPNITKVVMLDD